ncbi:MAG: hypothetical protein Q8N44_23090 [Rubrivivax sp.]|nr:hypothetical protein [Rubrivivax sp.]
MKPSTIDTALQEARLLAIYASRHASLPPNSRIFEALDSAEQARARGETPAMAPLMAEVQKVSRAAQMPLHQLIRRSTVMGRLSRHAARATPYLVGFMTLLLTLYLAFQSSELHKADLALREYQDLQGERLQEKLYQAWKLHHYERVLTVKGPPLTQLDSYQQLVSDAKRLYEKRSAVQDLLLDSAVIRYLPQLTDDASAAEFSAVPTPPMTASAPPREGQGNGELGAAALNCPAAPGVATPVLVGRAAPNGARAGLENLQASMACFVQSLSIERDHSYPMVSMVYATRNKVSLLVSWLLPGLYGLLGACVFLLRDLLHGNGVSRTQGDARIVDLLSLLLRVALGGLAGIIIGWFWVPSAASPISTAIPVSSLSFGIAFLAGYSIDSLFSLLDRLIRNFRQGDDAKGASKA